MRSVTGRFGRAAGTGAAAALLAVALTLAPAPLTAQELAGCLTSETLPIESCFETERERALAERALAEVEGLWRFLVGDVGLTAPWRTAADGQPEVGARVAVVDLGGQVAGYAEALADVPATSWSDCVVMMWIDRTMPASYLPSLLGHTFGHAVTMADECAAPLPHAINPYLELLYLEAAGSPVADYLAGSTGRFYYETFQAHPELPLDHFDYRDAAVAAFNYGHGLFLMFLDERYGAGDGALAAELSRAERQDGSVGVGRMGPYLRTGENEPDLYDAIDAVLPLHEAGAGFWPAVAEFAVWRLLTGARDDGHHLRFGGWLPAVAIDTQLALAELPVTGAAPGVEVHETGTVYLALSLDDAPAGDRPAGLAFRLAAAADSGHWSVAAVQLRGEAAASVAQTALEAPGGTLSVRVAEDAASVVFAVTWMGDLVHDPDDADWGSTPFTFDLAPLSDPVVAAVTPGELPQGAADLSLTVTGTGLEAGAALSFGDGVTVSAQRVEGTERTERIVATVAVAADAAIGPRDVVVTCADGREGRLAGGIEVVAPPRPVVSSLSPDAGRAGEAVTVRVRGANFAEGIGLAVSGGGVVVAALRRASDAELEADLDIAPDAPTGPRDVRLANPDGGELTLAGAFRVDPPREPAGGLDTGGGAADAGGSGAGTAGSGDGSAGAGGGGGGGCAAGGAAGGRAGAIGLALLLLLALVAGARRRDGRPACGGR
jgi:hypothetical protein